MIAFLLATAFELMEAQIKSGPRTNMSGMHTSSIFQIRSSNSAYIVLILKLGEIRIYYMYMSQHPFLRRFLEMREPKSSNPMNISPLPT